jgi:hypothetical protein
MHSTAWQKPGRELDGEHDARDGDPQTPPRPGE